MEVSKAIDSDDYTVVGGGEAMVFGISDSPEFFDVLSRSLYQRPEEAFIRETLCNHSDANIIAGKSDVPVRVTLTDKSIIFEDNGPGIPHKFIKPIYCVYGNSTKTKDGRQTGGFGLGSKSPFAYSQTFRVTNWHGGTKTIYQATKGSEESQGRPDFKPMVSVPTDRTGLKTEVPLQFSRDLHRLRSLIKMIAYYGGILVDLNGDILPRIEWEKATEGFVVAPCQGNEFQLEAISNVYLKYGQVIYPLPKDSEYESEFKYFEQPYKMTAGSYSRYTKLITIIEADPNSIAVQPSRESIAIGEHNNKAIKKKLTEIIERTKDQGKPAFNALFTDMVSEACKVGRYNKINNFFYSPRFDSAHPYVTRNFEEKPITDAFSLVKLLLVLNDAAGSYSRTFYDSKRRRMLACAHLIKMMPKHKKLWFNLYRHTKNEDQKNWDSIVVDYLLGYIPDKYRELVHVFDSHEDEIHPLTSHRLGIGTGSKMDFNAICLSVTKRDAIYGINREENLARDGRCLLILSSRKKGHADEIWNDLPRADIPCHDLRGSAPPIYRAAPAQRKPKGYIRLDEFFVNGKWEPKAYSSDDLKRIEEPTIAFTTHTKDHQIVLEYMPLDGFKYLPVLVPDAVVVTRTVFKNTLSPKKVKLGAERISEILHEHITGPDSTIRDYMYYTIDARNTPVYWLNRIRGYSKVIDDALKDLPVLTDYQSAVYYFYKNLSYYNKGLDGSHESRVRGSEMEKCLRDHNPKLDSLNELNQFALLDHLNFQEVWNSLSDKDRLKKTDRDRLIRLVESIVKGTI